MMRLRVSYVDMHRLGICLTLLPRYAAPRSPTLTQNIHRDAPGDSLRGLLHRIPRQMRVPGRGLHLAVAQQLSDHRQALPQRQCAAGIRMTQVMDPDAVQAGPHPDNLPGMIEGAHMRAPLPARYDPGIALHARETGQKLHR